MTDCETKSLEVGFKFPTPLSDEFGDSPPMEPPDVDPEAVEVELTDVWRNNFDGIDGVKLT